MMTELCVCLQLAQIHMLGLGVEANCTKAASFVRVVLQERRGWSEDIAEAVSALDEGEPWASALALVLEFLQASVHHRLFSRESSSKICALQ